MQDSRSRRERSMPEREDVADWDEEEDDLWPEAYDEEEEDY